jgi:hypothetical protein
VIPATCDRWNSRHSRSRIEDISDSLVHRQPASESRTRGLPAIGFQLEVPSGVMIEQTDPAGPDRAVVLRAREESDDGRLLGELELGIFSAAFIIDRGGVLQELVETAAAVALGGPDSGARLLAAGNCELAAGASGFRMDVVMPAGEPRAPRYVSWLALASDDLALSGGVFVTVRAAGPRWPAASLMLDSLRISGMAGAGVAGGSRLALPLLRGR